MATVTPDSWDRLPNRTGVYADLEAHTIEGTPGLLLAVDHDGARHILLPISDPSQGWTDDRSRGIRVATRELSVQGQPERPFIDVVCTDPSGQDVFNLVASTIVEQVLQGNVAADAVGATLARWRRFWSATPGAALSGEQLRGLFAELWFLAFWLLPRGHDQLRHWLGPTGARHDFQWPGVAVEVKATVSVRGHIHRVSGIDQLDPPESGSLYLFSLRLREETAAANSIVVLIERLLTDLAADSELLDLLETRLAQAGYSQAHADRYREVRYRIVNERLYHVRDHFPRLTTSSFTQGVPAGIERIEYEINLDSCPDLIVASSPQEPALSSIT
jgi:hypothetical protein